MDRSSYLKATASFSAKLKAGEVLTGKYYPNFLNAENLSVLESQITEGDALGMTGLYKSYQDHLVLMLNDIDLTEDKKKVPFGTEDEKRSALNTFSYDDLQVITKTINESILGPLEPTETDSSAG